MRSFLVTLTLLLLATLSPFAGARADRGPGDSTGKAPDLQTVGGVTGPVTTTPLDLTSPVTPPRAGESFGTSLPAGTTAPSAAQAAKRANVPAVLPAAPAANGDKLPDWSAPPPAATGPTLTPEEAEAQWRAAARKRAAATRGHGVADVLGPLPRAAWTTGLPVKPEAVVTAGPPTGLDAPPAPARAPASAKATAPKPAEFGTSGARDPNAPRPTAVKPQPVKEDRP